MDRLEAMLDRQYDLQARVFKTLDPDMSDEDKMAFVRTHVLALIDELHEALAETGWKPWATSNHLNADAFKGELVDAWHFFMNLMLVANMTAEDLYVRYMDKQRVNRKRQADGYDGVSSKCPGCRRAYDDVAVTCRPRGSIAPGVMAWCSTHETHYRDTEYPV